MQAEHGDIFDSIQSGNISEVKEFLDAGVPVNRTDEEGWSLLHHAAAGGQVEVIRLLHENGCYIDSVDVNGQTALHYAAANGFVESVRALIEMGGDVNALDNEHTTPLQWAVMSEQYAVMEALIEHGGSVDAGEAEPLDISSDLKPKTVSCGSEQVGLAVHNTRKRDIFRIEDDSQVIFLKTAQSGDTTGVTECLDLAVPVDLTDEDRGCYMSPVKSRIPPTSGYAGVHNSMKCDIFDAARSGDTAKLKEYLELGVSVDVTDEDGRTPLHCAAGEGQVDVVKLLIEKGCCINPVDHNGWTPSIYATMQGKDEVEVLLNLAKSVRDSTGWTPLLSAAGRGQLKLIEMLLSVGGRKLMTMVAGKGGTPLHQAAGYGHKDVVTLLLKEGCPIDIRDSNGLSALHLAAQCGQVVIMELLINHGLDVNVEDNEGRTPLHSAAANGQLESIHTLLRLGGKKSLPKIARKGGTPLHQAAGGGHKDVVILLLNEGCPIDIRDSDGITALHFAAERGHIVIFEVLVNHGLDVNVVDNEGSTPLHSAAAHSHLESILALLRLGGRRAMTMIARDAGTPLHIAVGRGNKDIVSLLLSEGCPMNMTNNGDLTALHIAAATGQVDMIEMLVGCGLDVNILDDRGRTPLHSAACENQLESARTLIGLGGGRSMTVTADGLGTPLHQAAARGHKGMVSLLLKEGCPIDVTDDDGMSVAHAAAMFGEADIVKLLVMHGLNVNLKGGDGSSALHVAAESGHVVIIKMLVYHGLDVNVEDNEGSTPLHSAAACGQLESVQALLRLGGRKSLTMVAREGGTPLHEAAEGGHKDVVSLLLKQGCPTNVTDGNGMSAAHVAAMSGEVGILELLVKHGLDVKLRDGDGSTALHVAARCGQVVIIEMLVEYGLDVNVVDNEGMTPLHSAAAHGQLKSVQTLLTLGGRKSLTKIIGDGGTPLHQATGSGHKDIVSLLLEEGCPTNVTDGKGMSAVHFAAMSGEVGIIEMLVKHGLDINLISNKGSTPMHIAAAKGQLESICTLLRSGGKASMLMDVGEVGTPLHQAVGKGYNDIVTLLLDEGCPVNVTASKGGLTALHVAANYDRMDLVDLLAKRGCDANAVDVYGWTPQFYGIYHMELMRRLRMSGSRISHRDKLGITIFEYSIALKSASIHRMKSYVEASGIGCDGSNFVNVITTLSKNNLIDINRVLCLAAVSGHVDLFDEIVDSDLPLDQQRIPKLVQALSIRIEDWEVIDNWLGELHILDDPLNPLHISLVTCKQLGPGAQSTAQHKYAERVISHPRTKYTIYELFPNGLSPLDVARQFELHDIAGMIERAGGRPGMWADLPKEMGQKSMEVLRSLKRVRGSEFGEDYFRTLLMMCGCVIKEEEGSKVAQNVVLAQTPQQFDIEECILSNVKELRKWRRVGELLQVDAPVLDKLAKDADGSDDAYYSMLKYWLEHGRSVTWKTLLDAIGYFETKKTMDDIRKKIERGLSVTNIPTSDTMLPSLSYGISYAKVTIGTASFLSLPPGGTQRSKARNAGGDFPHKQAKPKQKPYPKASTRFPKFQCDPTLTEANLWRLVGSKMHSRWKEFAVRLHVETRTTDVVYKQCLAIVEECFKEVTGRWLCGEKGTGDLPRTWETVFEALRRTGFPLLVEDVRDALLQGKFSDDCY